MRLTDVGLATMESFDGELCRTGRVAETDFDLCCRTDRQGVVRGDGQLGPRGDCRVREVEGCRSSPHRPGDGTDVDVAMDRDQGSWIASHLYRCPARQGVLKMQINKSDRNDAFGIARIDRKSTRLNSSHEWISYAVFC